MAAVDFLLLRNFCPVPTFADDCLCFVVDTERSFHVPGVGAVVFYQIAGSSVDFERFDRLVPNIDLGFDYFHNLAELVKAYAARIVFQIPRFVINDRGVFVHRDVPPYPGSRYDRQMPLFWQYFVGISYEIV